MSTKPVIRSMIAEHDQTLSMLREFWISAAEKDKPRFMEKINTALDRRLDLMAQRDAVLCPS